MSVYVCTRPIHLEHKRPEEKRGSRPKAKIENGKSIKLQVEGGGGIINEKKINQIKRS